MSDLLERRIAKILPDKEGLEKLARKQKLRVYIGIDPTASRLHLGHTIGLKKLMDFADAGHEAILLFGTGTVLVGDPSLRDSARKLIAEEQIEKNITTWKKQVAPLIDFNKVTIKQNGDWLTKLDLRDIIRISSNISAIQLFKRESFTRRIAKGDTVWYHETLYPLLQGYDSVAMDVDVEIGGTDQEFNMLMGRELQRKLNNREKYVVENPMILGTDGKQMSKTSGNCIWLSDTPHDMYGKLMSALDSQIIDYLTLLTDVDLKEVKQLEKDLESGKNPRDIKARMAHEVTALWHSQAAAVAAADAFVAQFQKGQVPDDIAEFVVGAAEQNVVELLVESSLAESKSKARRLVEQGAIKLNQKKVADESIKVQNDDVLQAGKRRFIKIKL